MKIGFIGLGNVGGKLARSLLRNQFNLTVIDLDDNLVKDFLAKGSTTAKSPKELAEKTDLIITTYSNKDLSVNEANELLSLGVNSIFIDDPTDFNFI